MVVTTNFKCWLSFDISSLQDIMAWILCHTRIESDTRIAPFCTSYRTLSTSYRTLSLVRCDVEMVRYECLWLDTSAIQESCHDVLFIIKFVVFQF